MINQLLGMKKECCFEEDHDIEEENELITFIPAKSELEKQDVARSFEPPAEQLARGNDRKDDAAVVLEGVEAESTNGSDALSDRSS